MAGLTLVADGMELMKNVPAAFADLEHLLPKPGEIKQAVEWAGKGITDTGISHLLGKVQGLEKAESIDLGHNILSDAGMRAMGEAAAQGRFNPKSLDLAMNGLYGIPANARNLTRLENLTLWGNIGFHGHGLEHLPGSLKSLDLGNTAIGEAAMRQLPNLRNLQFLNLSGIDRGHMTDQAWEHLRDLPNLRILSAGGAIRFSKFNDVAAQSISQLPIERLDVGTSNLTGAGLNEYIAKIPTLKRLQVGHYQGYGIKPADVRAFREQRPDVQVKYAFEDEK
jgi:hypothetical protein